MDIDDGNLHWSNFWWGTNKLTVSIAKDYNRMVILSKLRDNWYFYGRSNPESQRKFMLCALQRSIRNESVILLFFK